MKRKLKRTKFSRSHIVVIVFAAFIVFTIIIVCALRKNSTAANTALGVSYIKSMESIDAAEVENEIFNAARQERLAQMQEELENDSDQIWSMLSEIGTVLLGDSRVLGFSYYGWMDESRVLADTGARIYSALDYVDTLQMLNPHLVVLSYGINDIGSGYYGIMDSYLEDLNEIMQTLTDALPNAVIYVQAAFPITGDALEVYPEWDIADEWNAAIKADCEENGWNYLDLNYLAEDADVYEGDGIHFMGWFYPYWAEGILLQYLSDGLGDIN